MRYSPVPLPYRCRDLGSGWTLAISDSGDHTFLSSQEAALLSSRPGDLPLPRQAELKSRFFLASGQNPGMGRLLRSRRAAKRETVDSGAALHIIVPTLQCAHSCRYCQVSRALTDEGHTMSRDDLYAACENIFESPSKTLAIEFQGGDPLLRFDLVRDAILRIESLNAQEARRLRFVVASTLHQLTEEMCDFFREHRVYLSTSLDGPRELHNRNRPIPTRDSYERTVRGIELARRLMGPDAVSALMTTTRESLEQPEAIVDEYVRLGFRDVFLRPLSSYGFAKRNQAFLAYTQSQFNSFYLRGLERVLHWNRQGIELREVYTSILLNKALCTFDGGYVDLQSPTGAGQSVLVYNYDGYVYPSDEARMLAETGDASLRMGRIGTPAETLRRSAVAETLVATSRVEDVPGCRDCAYNLFCAPNPVDAVAQFGTADVPVEKTEHCQRHLWLFDLLFEKIRAADGWLLDLFHVWSQATTQGSE
jgi:His-Xaa-Ser system radical SAM maturase HxsB